MAFFQQDDKNEQGGTQGGALQAPVFTGTTNRDQMAPSTGGSSAPASSGGGAAPAPAPSGGGAPTPAPASGGATPAPAAGAAKAKAPAWTNLTTFLSSQSGAQQQATADKASGGLQQAAEQAQTATQAASGGVRAAAAGGVNAGSVGKVEGGHVTGTNPTVDLTRVDLSGYKGPSGAEAAQKFENAQLAGQKAQQAAQAAKSAGSRGNAFDSAVLRQSPGWGQLLQSVGVANQAARGAEAAAGGGQEAVAAAQRASDANVADQKAQLGEAQTAMDTSAANSQAVMKSIGEKLESGNPADILSVAGSTRLLQQLGLNPADLRSMVAGLQNGQLTPASVKEALSPYIAAAKAWTGYGSQSAADQANQIATLLGTEGKASVGQRGTGKTDLGRIASDNERAFQDLYDAYNEKAPPVPNGMVEPPPANGSYYEYGEREANAAKVTKAQQDYTAWAANRDAAQSRAIAKLAQAGFTPEEISKKTGIPVGKINARMPKA